ERKCVIWQRCNLKSEGYNAPRTKIASLPNGTMNNYCESEEIVEAANVAISNFTAYEVKIFIRYSLQSVQKVLR
ncbi:hypothetical protein NQ317_019679, partial [Molorchus minor]